MSDRTQRTLQLPNGNDILEVGYVLAGFGIHRDSDPLDESNYYVAMNVLIDSIPEMNISDINYLGRPWVDAYPQDAPITIASFKHWGVGWIEELMIRADRQDLLDVADGILEELEDYPVLDEYDYSMREWEINHPEGDALCYSEDPDCGCGRVQA